MTDFPQNTRQTPRAVNMAPQINMAQNVAERIAQSVGQVIIGNATKFVSRFSAFFARATS